MNIVTDILTYEEYSKKRMKEIQESIHSEISSATTEDKEGYKEEEFTAMVNVEQWNHVDIKAEYNRYKESILEEFKAKMKVINHKVNYKNISKLSFNNFKPFGTKLQSFSKKPITLIYGPNSIGKSSFIHMSAYLKYIFETESFNLTDTDMFGDEINLGGFEKFIHKRDKNNTLTFEFDFIDCTPAIIEYLGLSDMDFTHTEALHSFTKKEIIDIIVDSKKYIHDKTLCNSFYNPTNDRSKNNACNNIYKNELEYFGNHSSIYGIDPKEYINGTTKLKNEEVAFTLSVDKKLSFYNNGINIIDKFMSGYYNKYPYIKSYGVINDHGETEDIPSYKLYTKEGEFKNNECRNCFISDILIPHYINFAKYLLIGELSDHGAGRDIINLQQKEIEAIADNTIKMINIMYELFSYYKELKSKDVSLKILIEIENRSKLRDFEFQKYLDDTRLKRTKYFIDNTLYDAIEEIVLQDDIGKQSYFTAAASYDYINFGIHDLSDEKKKLTNLGEFGYPKILDDAPDICKSLLFNKPDYDTYYTEYQKESEKNNSIFLSYKKGYNKLIGTFNDMIYFKDMQYIGPLRFYPERESNFREVGKHKIKVPNSKESWSLLKNDESLRDKINTWLKNPNKLKTPYEIKYRKLYDIESSFFNLDFERFNKIQESIHGRNNEIQIYKISSNMSEDNKIYAANKIAEKLAREYLENLNIKYTKEQLKITIMNLGDISDLVDDLIDFSTLNQQDKFKKILIDDGAMDILNTIESKEELVFEDLRNNTKISNRDLGLGISQILPILIATNNNKNMTIAVEQPELHLHPAVQCEIADEFIRSYKENKNEFLIETHSEHLLLRIMKRMRHTAEDKEGRDKTLDLTPDDVCLLYVDTDSESTYIKELRLSKKGKLLDHWPGGFFEEGYKERFQ